MMKWRFMRLAVATAIWFASTSLNLAIAQQPDFILGVCNHLAHGRSTAQQSLHAMHRLGVNSFRDDVFWSLVETEKDVFRWPQRFNELERAVDLSRERGIEPLIILAYENRLHHAGRYPISDQAQAAFTRFAEYVVKRFKGRVRYYEVWNEWNQGGTAPDYVRLLKRVYPAIKQIDPQSIVLGGAVEGAGPPKFIRDMMEQGALPFMDGLSVHPYVFWRGRTGTPEAMYQWTVDLQKMLHQFSAGRDVPLYVTEIGWPTDATTLGITQQQAADYAAQMTLMMRSLPYVRGVWWYNLFNTGQDAKDRGQNFGLFTENERAKPSAEAFSLLSALVRQGKFLRREDGPPGSWALRFANNQGQETMALFNTKDTPVRVQGIESSQKLSNQVLQSRANALTGTSGQMQLMLTATPILVSGNKQALARIELVPISDK